MIYVLTRDIVVQSRSPEQDAFGSLTGYFPEVIKAEQPPPEYQMEDMLMPDITIPFPTNLMTGCGNAPAGAALWTPKLADDARSQREVNQ